MSYPISAFLPPTSRADLGNVYAVTQQGVAVPRGPASSGWETRRIGNKDIGTRDTVKVMAELAVAGSMHPGIRIWAERITRPFRSKDYEAELQAIFDTVTQNVRYMLDPRAYEYVQHPAWLMFVSGTGDCDDMATLLAALTLAAGHSVFFRTIRADPGRQDEFSHIYAVLGWRDKAGSHWRAADATHPTPESATFGWEALQDAPYGYVDWPVAT